MKLMASLPGELCLVEANWEVVSFPVRVFCAFRKVRSGIKVEWLEKIFMTSVIVLHTAGT